MRQRFILGRLVATTAVHVGAGLDGGVSDAMVRRDARGRVVVPGTSIAGALREMATRLAPRLGDGRICMALQWQRQSAGAEEQACGCPVCVLFGDLRPGVGDRETPENHFYSAPTAASRLIVYDAVLLDPALALVRDGLGMDRASGAGARAGAVKFDQELVPPGSEFQLRLELDMRAGDQDERLLAAVLAEWVHGRGRLGARRNAGLGWFRLQPLTDNPESGSRSVDFFSINLDDPGTLEEYLRADEPWDDAARHPYPDWLERRLAEARQAIRPEASDESLGLARCWVEVTMELRADGQLITKDSQLDLIGGTEAASLSNDLPPRDVEGTKGWTPAAVLPGSALRGVLRTHAEKVARTLWTARVVRQPEGDSGFCPACNPTESRLPGQDGVRTVPLPNCDTLLRGAREETPVVPDDEEVAEGDLCLACRLFGSTRRGSRLSIADAALYSVAHPWAKVRDFVAIDRFLGGALDGAKFDAIVLQRPVFGFRLRFENPRAWELGWLALCLRDLRQGLLRVGWGTSKGLGKLSGRDLKVRLGFLTEVDLPDPRPVPGGQSESGVYTVWEFSEADLQANLPSLDEWTRQFVGKVEGFQRQERLASPDGYVDRPQLRRLYGGETHGA